jgi:hypothetical protein
MLKRVWWIVGVALILSGCMGADTAPKDMPGKKFGILNLFPENPLYLKKQTLVARDKSNEIEGLGLKSWFTQTAIEYLSAKGYQAEAVDNKAALSQGEVDILIEIVPLEVFKMEGMEAYGFSDRNFLLGIVKQPGRSYVAMQLKMSRRNSTRVMTTKREEQFSKLGVDMMPHTWDGLTNEEKKAFEENLRENITKVINLSMSQLKI